MSYEHISFLVRILDKENSIKGLISSNIIIYDKNLCFLKVYVLSGPRHCLPICNTGSAFTSVARGHQVLCLQNCEQ